jgi:hypothetical protein
VTGEIHDGVADEAENIGGGASREILEKEKIPPDNENPPDVKPTVDTDSQVHIESVERFGADRRQQICLKSMMLPREECSSNFVKKLARKFAASPATEICEHKPMMEYKLTDNLVGMAGTKASKEDTLSPRKTSLEGQGQPEQWPPPTGWRGRQAMTSPRQSPPIRLPPLDRSIKAVNDERVHDRGAEVEPADVEEGVVRVQDKGGGVETRVPKPGEINEENDAEIVKRPDDQEVDNRGGDSHDVAAGVDEHANDNTGGQVNVDKITAGGDGHASIAAGVIHVRVRYQSAHAQDEARVAGGGDHDGDGGRWDIRVQGGEGDKAAKDNAACTQEEVREAVIHGGEGHPAPQDKGGGARQHDLPGGDAAHVKEEVRGARVHGGGVHAAHRRFVRLQNPRKSSMEDQQLTLKPATRSLTIPTPTRSPPTPRRRTSLPRSPQPTSHDFGIDAIQKLLASNAQNFDVIPVDVQDEVLATEHDQVPEGLDTTAHDILGDRVQVEVQTIGGRDHDDHDGWPWYRNTSWR